MAMSMEDSSCEGIHLSIEDYYFISDGSTYDQHFFIVQVQIEDHKYTVDRSYMEFVELDRILHKTYPTSSVPTLPLRAAPILQQYLFGQDSKKKSSNKQDERRKSIVTRDSLTPSKSTPSQGIKTHLNVCDSTEIIKNRVEPLNKYLSGLLRYHELLTSSILRSFLDEEITTIFDTSMPSPLTEYDLLLINMPLMICTVHKIEHRVFEVPADHILLWRFIVTDFDIGFLVEAADDVKLPLTRYRSSQGPICGALQVTKPSLCKLKWDNTYAKLHSKEIMWSACVVSKDDFVDAKKRALACEQEKKRFERQRYAYSRAVNRLATNSSGVIHGSIIEAENAEEVDNAIRSLDETVLSLTQKNETLLADLKEAELRIDDLEHRLEDSEKSKDVVVESWKRASMEIENLQNENESLNQDIEDMENLLLEKEANNLNIFNRLQLEETRDRDTTQYLDTLLENIQIVLSEFQNQYLEATDISKDREMDFRETFGASSNEQDSTQKFEKLHFLICSSSYDNITRALRSNRPCVKWGNTFDVSLTSENVIRSCTLPDSRPVCCSAVEKSDKVDNKRSSKPIGENMEYREDKFYGDECKLTKVYVSSPQELRDLQFSEHINSLSADHTDTIRLETLVNYTISEEIVRNSSLWLDRVKYHMSSEKSPEYNKNLDFEFLSRFEFTRTCGSKIEKWIEWIEPLTITARHPFAFGRCRNARPFFKPSTPRTDRSNVDYVLLQSGKNLIRQFDGSVTASKTRNHVPKHFMFDAGTSTFDSSLFWFLCGYSQRKVGFDSVYGWEMTLLEPTDYWSRVPSKWKPYWHFHNIPIEANSDSSDSPIRYLKELAKPEDFVAFKLDIDNPKMEMPIAMSLLNDESVSELVDEFFFELHFRCEVMTSCGWGKRVPSESHSLILDRPHVLKFFIDLRKRGIRAHIWP